MNAFKERVIQEAGRYEQNTPLLHFMGRAMAIIVMLASSATYPLFSQQSLTWAAVSMALFLMSCFIWHMLQMKLVLLYGHYTILFALIPSVLILVLNPATLKDLAQWIPAYATALSLLLLVWPDLEEKWHNVPFYIGCHSVELGRSASEYGDYQHRYDLIPDPPDDLDEYPMGYQADPSAHAHIGQVFAHAPATEEGLGPPSDSSSLPESLRHATEEHPSGTVQLPDVPHEFAHMAVPTAAPSSPHSDPSIILSSGGAPPSVISSNVRRFFPNNRRGLVTARQTQRRRDIENLGQPGMIRTAAPSSSVASVNGSQTTQEA